MKKIIAGIALFALATMAGAQSMHRGLEGPFQDEALEIFEEYWDSSPASLTFAEIDALSSALSVPAQKNRYVRRSAGASFIVPGLGQFMNDEPLLGTAFLLADIAIATGATIGYYLLLPPELQFDELNYFTTPFSEIKDEWEAAFNRASFQDALPYLGIATGALILDLVLSSFASANARELAITRIEAGEVTFVPRAGIITDGLGTFGVGFGFGY